MSSKKKKAIDFIITTDAPNEADRAANKRRVRSVAALKSWPERRKRTFQNLDATGGQSTFLVNPPPKPDKPKKRPEPPSAAEVKAQGSPAAPLSRASASKESTPFEVGTPTSDATLSSQALSTLSRSPHSLVAALHTSNPETPCQCPQCQLRRQLANSSPGGDSSASTAVPIRRKRTADGEEKPLLFSGDLAMITPPASPGPAPSSGRADPFNCYPVPYQPWFDSILHHMLVIYGPRGWPALRITNEQGMQWEWFMTQNALADAALFYVRLLYGSGDLIRLGTLKPEIMMWLRGQAVRAITEALSDPVRAMSDPLILAVGRIALHESLYGDKAIAVEVHRPAQQRMIEMRGGMKALNFPDIIKRLMRWSDSVMAIQSGTARLLEDDTDEENFTLKQSVEVLERWVPREGESLRSQIRITDLVNEQDVS